MCMATTPVVPPPPAAQGRSAPRSAMASSTPVSAAPAGSSAADLIASKIVAEGFTFDDVLLLPRYSNVMPAEADTSTRLTPNIRLKIPLVSAPMDTVPESAPGVALAAEGRIGRIPRNPPQHPPQGPARVRPHGPGPRGPPRGRPRAGR